MRSVGATAPSDVTIQAGLANALELLSHGLAPEMKAGPFSVLVTIGDSARMAVLNTGNAMTSVGLWKGATLAKSLSCGMVLGDEATQEVVGFLRGEG